MLLVLVETCEASNGNEGPVTSGMPGKVAGFH
jgi:hypothetical protein